MRRTSASVVAASKALPRVGASASDAFATRFRVRRQHESCSDRWCPPHSIPSSAQPLFLRGWWRAAIESEALGESTHNAQPDEEDDQFHGGTPQLLAIPAVPDNVVRSGERDYRRRGGAVEVGTSGPGRAWTGSAGPAVPSVPGTTGHGRRVR